jgi:hypothetical protein
MGWVNVHWGMLRDTNVTHIFPHLALLAFDKVVKLRCASLFLA